MKRERRRGAAAMEFALWLPIMMLVFAGIVDLASFVSTLHRVSRSARDGARLSATLTYASMPVGATATVMETSLEARCVSQATAVLTDSGGTCGTGCTITCNWYTDTSIAAAGLRSPPEIVEATVKVRYNSVFKLIPALSGRNSTARFRMLTQIQVADIVP
jgi:Flp pilus assembly protein TadG